MKIIVCGSRSWISRVAIRERLLLLPPGSTVVHGASKGGGADRITDYIARLLGLTVIPVPVSEIDYERASSRRAAPIYRNLRMLNEHPDADRVDAYWDGVNPGTKHMIGEARRRGIPVEVILATPT